MKYYNENDGKLYDTVDELNAAENKRIEAERVKKEKAEQKEARLKEVNEAYKKYCELVKAYNKDYSDCCTDYLSYPPLDSLINLMLNH